MTIQQIYRLLYITDETPRKRVMNVGPNHEDGVCFTNESGSAHILLNTTKKDGLTLTVVSASLDGQTLTISLV